MLTALDVKQEALAQGADLVGIAPLSRFEGAPKQMDPREIFPDAKSMIVLGFRIARGTLRGIEEGTLFNTYPSMGYAAINQIYGPMVLWNVTRYLEDRGYETIPLLNVHGGEAVNPVTGNFRKGWSRRVRPDKPFPDVLIHFRLSAYLAGLGEIGWSKVFLTPQFGPRQRFALMLTDAELEPDPIYEGRICDRCMLCAKNCSSGAISRTESVKIMIAGREIEWGRLDPLACEQGLQGGPNKELNPFEGEYPRVYGYGRAVEGACGCIRACMIHLEERRKIQNIFHRPFRSNKPWSVDRSKPYELPPEIEREYGADGRIEDAGAYVSYNKRDNYGTHGKEASSVNPLID